MVAEGYKDTEIGVIPDKWDVVKIQDIGKISTSSIDKKIYPDERIVNMVNYMDVYNNHYKEINSNIKFMKVSCNENQLNSCQILKGDVLFTPSSETSDDIGLSAVVNDVPNDTVHSYHLVRLRFTKELSLHFKKFAFNNTKVLEQFTKASQGTTRKTLKVSDFQNIKIPLPPLKEQEKIADILSTADDKIDAIAIQMDKAETLKQGLLQKLLSEGIGHSEFKDSELGKIPESWEVVELKSIIKDMIAGVSVNSEDRQKSEEEYGILKTSAIQNGSFLPDKHKTILNTEIHRATTNPLADHIIFSRMNTPDLVGQSGYVEHTIKDLFLPDRLWQLDVKDRDIVFVKWLSFILASSDTFNMIKISATGTSNSMKNISKPSLLKIKISLPPLAEQKQIADILSTADEKLEVLRAKKEKYETLKKGLLQKLLSGEVRV